MALLDTNQSHWLLAPGEFGDGVEIGQLLTPLTRFSDYGSTYAIDNGAYAEFRPAAFRSLLKRQEGAKGRCIFVAVPDVVGSARRTLEVFNHWRHELRGWPLALVAQNGQENLDIPWCEIKAIFIGGDDEFKDGPEATAIGKAAIALDKHLHFGRVNGTERLKRIHSQFGGYRKLSIDGSGLSMYSHMRINAGRAVRGETLDPDDSIFNEVAA